MLNTEDIAYIISRLEKSPSNYPGRQKIIDELQNAWSLSNKNKTSYRMPIAPPVVSIELKADKPFLTQKDAADVCMICGLFRNKSISTKCYGDLMGPFLVEYLRSADPDHQWRTENNSATSFYGKGTME